MLFALPLPVQARQVVFLYAHSTYRHSQTILLSLRSVFFYLPYLSPCKHGRWYFATLIPPTGTRKQSCSRCARCFFICLAYLRASTEGKANKKTILRIIRKIVFSLVPVVGLEPTRMISPQDFESSASASFTTPAQTIL